MFKDLEPGIITKISAENLLNKIRESTNDNVNLNKALLSLSEIVDVCEGGNDNISDLYILLTPSNRESRLFGIAVYNKNHTTDINNMLILFKNLPVLEVQVSEVKKALISK